MAIKLHQLTLEQVTQKPLSIQISIQLGISLLILALGYGLLIRKNLAEYNYLHTIELHLKTKLRHQQHQTATLSAYQVQLKTLKNRFARMLKRLPTNKELPLLFAEISQLATDLRLQVKFFAPQPQVRQDFYVEVPIKIAVAGSYWQITKFLQRLAVMKHMIILSNFSIQHQNEKKHQSILGEELIMNLTAKVYRDSSS